MDFSMGSKHLEDMSMFSESESTRRDLSVT